jgi:hypothetical protein
VILKFVVLCNITTNAVVTCLQSQKLFNPVSRLLCLESGVAVKVIVPRRSAV